MKTDIFTIENDIEVLCVQADSFPNGVLAAHQKLHSLLPTTEGRSYFGISYGAGQGEIIYKAAVSALHENEAQQLGCESFTIKKGNYNSVFIDDFKMDIPRIGRTFEYLLSNSNLDPNGYCLEFYEGRNNVRCMVKMAD